MTGAAELIMLSACLTTACATSTSGIGCAHGNTIHGELRLWKSSRVLSTSRVPLSLAVHLAKKMAEFSPLADNDRWRALHYPSRGNYPGGGRLIARFLVN